MYDDFGGKMRKDSEDFARRAMEEKGVDGKRIIAVSEQIREILDTGSSEEIAFLQGMLDAAMTVVPFYYATKKQLEAKGE